MTRLDPATTLAFAIVLFAPAARAEAPALNGDDLVPGRTYEMDEVYPPAAKTDLRFEARCTVVPADPPTLHVDVVIINARHTRRMVELGRGCWDVRVRLYTSPRRRTSPAWDSASSEWRRAQEGLVCRGTGLAALLEPNASTSPPNFHAEMTLSELHQGSLRPGTYHVTAEVRLLRPDLVVEVPAGSVVLRRP